MIKYFGIRHLSPVCAYFLREFLQRENPELLLVEGPSDLDDLMDGLVSKEAQLPAAILAYTKEAPIETVLYPFAEFSPEYQAILWAKENDREVRFCDLPSGVSLAHYRRMRELAEVAENADDAKDVEDAKVVEARSVYEQIEVITGVEHDAFWEYTFEQCADEADLVEAMAKYGAYLREFSERDPEGKETSSLPHSLVKKEAAVHEALRESCMRWMIAEAAAKNPAQKIVVVTGAYHTSAVQQPCTDEDRARMERLQAGKLQTEKPQAGKHASDGFLSAESRATLMPYSYYRLSEHSGYGAGAKSPFYYEILWRSRNAGGSIELAAVEYLTRLATYQRIHGNMASSAQVIEALRLAKELAAMHGGAFPALSDLRAAAVTCLGEGSFAQISLAVADTEIGTKIGKMPEGTVCTSVQDDFNRALKELKLEKYRSAELQELELDLRENLRVKSEEAAFLDLHRSFFLHRLAALKTGFAEKTVRRQDNATWAEKWNLRWTPEVEIRIVEASLKGDTIEQAAAAVLGERLLAASTVKETTAILAVSLEAGLVQCVQDAIRAVQRQAAGNEALRDVGNALGDLSMIVRFGNIRRIDTSEMGPLMEKLFLKFCLNLSGEAVCDEAAAKEMLPAFSTVWDAVLIHEFLDRERLVKAFRNLAEDDMANPLLSGFACGALTERGDLDAAQLYALMERHLAKGMPASDGAFWFEGFAERNHRALISRLGIWEHLAAYIAELDEEEFKAAVICLRRTFSTFTPAEKLDIAENICEVLGVSGTGGEAYVTAVLTEQETQAVNQAVADVDDFDFDI
ncbi:MAG: hypothetical protein IJ794_05280 [Lachnospiraceae bacterium]|nr:hypothetical protein [Lachnospiraceae bacterium]